MRMISVCATWLIMSLVLCGAADNEKENAEETQMASLTTQAKHIVQATAADKPIPITDSGSVPSHAATNDKRFDRISSASSFGKFGKRAEDEKRFDRISSASGFGRFGKRDDAESSGENMENDKRFDRISSASGFAKFGKREEKDDIGDLNVDKKFDRISSASGFAKFGKRQESGENLGEEDKRFDRISSASGFAKFGKRDDPDPEEDYEADDKRFDRISSASNFAKFGKRQEDFVDPVELDNRDRRFDRISSATSFAKFGKREDDEEFSDKRFDRISAASGFAKFGKREGLPDMPDKKFDRISASSGFTKFGKRQDFSDVDDKRFDRISSASGFAKFGKRQNDEDSTDLDVRDRRFDRISSASGFSKFGKREDEKRFDRISSASGFAKFGKREDGKRFDRISSASSFGKFGKRTDEVVPELDESSVDFLGAQAEDYDEFDKRAFDRIGGSSAFAKFGKRMDYSSSQSDNWAIQKRAFDRIAPASAFAGFGKRDMTSYDKLAQDALAKRKFDRIAFSSSFGGLGKRPHSFAKTKKPLDSISSSRFASFGKRISVSPSLSASDVQLDDLDKRKFDSIAASSFGRFGKRLSVAGGEDDSSFLKDKRTFDRISSLSKFSSFGKRDKETDGDFKQIRDSNEGIHNEESLRTNVVKFVDDVQPKETALEDTKHPDNHVTSSEGVRTLAKRDTSSVLGSIARVKRGFDSIAPSSSFGGFGKRRLDSIGSYSSFGSFGKRMEEKRRLDSIAPSSAFGRFGKRELDSQSLFEDSDEDFLPGLDDDETFEESKRRFDRIGASSSFGRYGKRNGIDLDSFEDDQLQSPVITRRRFDRIGNLAGFGSFGKRSPLEPYVDVRKIDLDTTNQRRGDYYADEGKVVFPSSGWERYIDAVCGPLNLQERGDPDSYTSSESTDNLGVPNRLYKRRFDSIGNSGFSRFRKRFWYTLGREPEPATPTALEKGGFHYLSFCRLAMLLRDYYSALAQQDEERRKGARYRRAEDKRKFDRIAYGHFAKWGRK